MPQRDDPPSRCALRRTGTIDDQATGGGEEGGGGKEESRCAGVCSEVQIETLPADQQEPARKEWETSPTPVQPPRTMALSGALREDCDVTNGDATERQCD